MAIVQLEGGPFDGENALVEATPAEVLEMSQIRLFRLGRLSPETKESAIYRPVQLRPEGDEREYDVLMAHVGPAPFSEGGYVDYLHRREIRVRERSASSFEDLLIIARLLPGRIVCAIDLREEQIAEARYCGRYWVAPDGAGWAALPWSITTEKDRLREGRHLLKLVENFGGAQIEEGPASN